MGTQPSKTILIVDDDPDDIFLLKSSLEKSELEGIEIDSATNMDEGLKKLQSQTIEICFVDFRLGAVTGPEFLREAQNMQFSSHTQFVMLTGIGDQEIAVQSMKAGAVDFLEKDAISPQLLENVIRKLLLVAEQSREIRQKQLLYEAIFKKTSDAILVLRDDLSIERSNENFRELFPNITEGQTFQDIFEDEVQRDTIVKLISEKQFPSNRKIDLPQADNICTCLLTVVEMDPSGGGTRFLVLINDISKFMEAEEQINIAEKLSMTSTLSRVIGHEVRNPLTNLKLALSSISGGEHDPEQDIYFQIMERNLERIESLVQDLLQSARPARQQKYSLDLKEVVLAALERCQDRINLNEVETDLDLQENLPPISGARGSLELAITNLILNAVQAMKDSETKTLSLKLRQGAPERIELVVGDTGIGMTRATQSKIFDPYFSTKTSGTGLGLTGSRNIFNDHNCHLSLKSAPGKGTRFFLHFPTSP